MMGKTKKIKMTEAAYIAGTDLARILGASNLLGGITPGNSRAYIEREDYGTVMKILSKWHNAIFKIIETIDEETA